MRHETAGDPYGLKNIGLVSSNATTRGAQIEALLDGMEAHGLQTFQTLVGHNWVDYPQSSSGTSTNTTPDETTFTIIEDWLTRAHARGLFLHLWLWADDESGSSSDNLVGGTNGYVDLRVQRFIAARLGAFPNVSMSYSWDLEEWVTKAEVLAWRGNMTTLSTLPRLYFARQTQERAPSPVFDLGDDQLGVFSWDGYPTNGTEITGHSYYDDALDPQESNPPPDGRPAGLPMMYEARFFINRPVVGSTHTYSETETRRLLWQLAMANGTGAIIGTHASPYNVDYTYPERFKTLTDFMDLRFHQLLNIVTTVGGVAVDGLALANASGSLQLLYKEDASSIDVTIPANLSGVPVVAQNCVAAHSEQSLGTYDAGTHTISLGSTSDWAVAVGQFGAPAEDGAPAETDIYMSLTGSDTTGDGSIGSPYRSIAKAGAEAETLAAAGTTTTIYLRGGYYDELGVDVYLTPNSGLGTRVKFSGTETAPITVRSYPGEWAVFDGLNHSEWPLVEDLDRDAQEPTLIQFVGEWVNWEYLEFRNSVGRGMQMYSLDCKYRYLVTQNTHASGFNLNGSRNEMAYCLMQDSYSISNGGNTGNGMHLQFSSALQDPDRFPSETGSRDNHIHHNIAWNCSDDGINYVPGGVSNANNVFEYNIAVDSGYGWAGGSSGNGEGFKMGLSGSNTGTICRFILAWGNNTSGFSNNEAEGVLFHNNTAWDSGNIGFILAAGGRGDNEAYNNLSVYPDSYHRNREVGVTVHTHNAGYPGAWDILGGEGNFDTPDVDPQIVSYDWTNADFLRLGSGSPYLSNGKVITGGSTTLGAIPDGEDFAGGWDWRTLASAYPSNGLRSRTPMYPMAQGTRTPYPGT
jgi:hypothetical protein